MAVRSILKLAADKAAAGQDVVTQVATTAFLREPAAGPPAAASEFEGNVGRLLLGLAQHTRVNDPNFTLKPNKYGSMVNQEPTIGVARSRMEIGGPLVDAGMLFGRYLGAASCEMDRQKYRIARIIKGQPSHMHSVTNPMHVNGRGRWMVEFEHTGAWKDPMDGNNMGSDPFCKFCAAGFSNAQAAMAWCHQFGFGFEVEIPRHRYHTRKSYADNFKWRGPDN